MTAPVIPNGASPIAAVLVDPTNGTPYKVGSADTASVVAVANISSPLGVTWVDPNTGIPYH